MPVPSTRAVLVNAMILGLCLGCGRNSGPELGTVSGTVTLDGKPLPRVNITFVPEAEKGSPSYGGTDADGKYNLLFTQDRAGAMLGKHRVEIQTREPETDDSGKPIGPAETVQLPKKYLQPGALTAEVKAGANEINFDLVSK